MRTYTSNRHRGSALISAVIFVLVLTMLLASLLTWTTNERKFSFRHALWLESRNAAEAIAEYGFSQIAAVAGTRNLIADGSTLFKSGDTYALQLPSATFFQGGHIYTATTGSNKPEIFASTATKKVNNSSSSQFTYTKGVENFMGDIEVYEQTVYRRDVIVYAKATAVPSVGNPITSYIRQTMSIRGIPLFTSAIFYNMDMELAPGPTFNVGGPVKVNGNLFISANQSSSSTTYTDEKLNFKGPVNVGGSVYHSWKGYANTTHGGGSEGLNTTADVTFRDNNTGNQVSMLQSGIWRDSTLNGTDKNGNPLNGSSTINYTNYTVGGIDANQAAYNLALSTAVGIANASSQTTPTTWTNFADTASKLWHGGLKTKAGGATASKLPFPESVGQYSEQTTTGTDDSNNSGRLLIEPKDTTASANAEIEAQKFATKAGVTIRVNPNAGVADADRITFVVGASEKKVADLDSSISTLAKWSPYTTTGTTTKTVTGGMFDRRRGLDDTAKGEVNLVELDFAALRTAVKQIATSNKTIPGLTPSAWNGMIYIEVVGGPTTRATDGGTTSTKAGTTVAGSSAAAKVGIMIKNGQNSSGNGTPTYGSEEGLTIATNGPVYIWGNLNANGTITSTSLNAVDSTTEEKPMAIAADAITVLSPGWDRTKSRSTNSPDVTNDGVEISCAFITGITPTNKNGNGFGSGGAHNIVRFLENWNPNPKKSTNIRGSLVCLYESRVATERFALNYYGAPARNWGLNALFTEGKFPPGTPMTISFRRINFTELSPSAYATAISAL